MTESLVTHLLLAESRYLHDFLNGLALRSRLDNNTGASDVCLAALVAAPLLHAESGLGILQVFHKSLGGGSQRRAVGGRLQSSHRLFRLCSLAKQLATTAEGLVCSTSALVGVPFELEGDGGSLRLTAQCCPISAVCRTERRLLLLQTTQAPQIDKHESFRICLCFNCAVKVVIQAGSSTTHPAYPKARSFPMGFGTSSRCVLRRLWHTWFGMLCRPTLPPPEPEFIEPSLDVNLGAGIGNRGCFACFACVLCVTRFCAFAVGGLASPCGCE